MRAWLLHLTVVMVLSCVRHVTSQQECWTMTFAGSSHNFATVEECQAACTSDSTCDAIAWEPCTAGKTCWLLTSDPTQPGVITHYTPNRSCLDQYHLATCGSVVYDTRRYYCKDGKIKGHEVHTCPPGRSVIVHLFNWKWTDIARECETFLGPNQFCGVQVSPPNEHVIIGNPYRPWYERYQPISYKLGSRSGSEAEFIDMVQRCNAVNVRIFVDAVINHMCGSGVGSGTGSAGSWYNSHERRFSGVEYDSDDFNCCHCAHCTTSDCGIQDYNNAQQVRNCRLVSLLDLKLGSEKVRGKIVSYLNRLIDIGVAGFRVDAAKHMWPGDMQIIYDRLNDLSTDAGFASYTRPFIFNEVIDLGGEAIGSSEYIHLGRVTEFRYSRDLGKAFRRVFALSVLSQFASFSWKWLTSDRAVVFVDNHDNQRGHGAGGADILTFYNGRRYRLATAFALAHPYGFTRIMSSYRWPGGPHSNDWIGPPHNAADGSILDVTYGTNDQCQGDWVCEHRWPLISAMVTWRNVAGNTALRHWWDDGQRQIAFSRAGRAFIAINDDNSKSMNVQLQTGLPAGDYCDVASGQLTEDSSQCTGGTVTVSSDGRATISIGAQSDDNSGTDPIIAIHVGAKVGACLPTPSVTPVTQPSGFQRTVIFMEFRSEFGQHVFIRGGISHERRSACSTPGSTACSMPINHPLSTRIPDTQHYADYRAWASGDTVLDWGGAEAGQGTASGGRAAHGSPAAWTTDDSSNTAAYHSLNRHGAHHWLLDVDMNCDSTEDGWFELKAYVTDDNNGSEVWERDVTQAPECDGDIGGYRPYASGNHMARCGFINVFVIEQGSCTINSF